ncbi:MAG: hypothetical protein RLZZ71_155 [Bacteroidota bacterium]|jgi:glycosyltransferase involved in cell wall biosynthesis
MKLIVFSHKVCWRSSNSSIGYATNGGFVFHMQALCSSYKRVYLLVPISKNSQPHGEIIFTDPTIQIVPLSEPFGEGVLRKILFPFWLLFHLPKFIFYILKSDIVHAPIPGDVGTIALFIAPVLRKKLFIRYCGNWYLKKTIAEKFWGWYGEIFAGGRVAYLTTGGGLNEPSLKNKHIKWIFSSSMSTAEISSYPQKNFELSHSLTIASGGRLNNEKGFGILLDALALVYKKFPKVNLDIYGDGPDRKKFQRKAEELGIIEKVNFLGNLNNVGVHQVLSRADIFCFPTYSSEGFPKVIIEAMAHGLPVLSTNVSVIPSLIASQSIQCGKIVNTKDSEDLANKILYYLENPEIHLEHAINAKKVASDYSLENWVDQINTVLNSQWKTEINRKKQILK